MQVYVNLNGKLLHREKAFLSPDNRSFRYGDGCFETMKLVNGKILLKDYHFERLFSSLTILFFNVPVHFTSSYVEKCILELALKNGHQHLGRIRLTIFRGEGGLYDPTTNTPEFLIQSWPLNETTNQLNTNGLDVEVYSAATKVADTFSGVKSNSFLCYVLGAQWAKQNRLNDCILLNPAGNIADATIANVFAVKNDVVITPPLSDGPINGVMRRHLLSCLQQAGIPFMEQSIHPNELRDCSEVFLTNAISGIKWIKQLEGKHFGKQVATSLHQQFVAPLFSR